MKPPSGGPSTGASSEGQTISAMAAMTSDLPALRSTRVRPTGAITPAAMPCKALAATSCPRLCARPQANEASVKVAMAMENTRRASQRSASQPLLGMTAAAASR